MTSGISRLQTVALAFTGAAVVSAAAFTAIGVDHSGNTTSAALPRIVKVQDGDIKLAGTVCQGWEEGRDYISHCWTKDGPGGPYRCPGQPPAVGAVCGTDAPGVTYFEIGRGLGNAR